ncbi:DNA-binding bromodomain-containing protein, putative isoform 1 [Theobroma cacao]|uniref:DNA-binding bromodomain-containing protein, putative isoform 1 n=1 Tax=Theobroma cacao TaxID=3641 RepID=A0A061GSR2_THECC|nr:DNA-binding bromodomain-containing protein, putative isoform 1 [Theobroma cacao]EOY32464.1 DNA-binding bromodomain-containing protein, putative isoform 1 [Theobroma cacao]
MAREHETSAQPWGTLEELLLACAVNRHGTKSWDSIALELQNRRTSSSFTPQLCKDKFFDLKRRFISPNDAASSSSLVDQLRRIRVEELRREVQRRDVSIVSLELKVKRLVEERDRSLKEEADLDDRLNKPAPDIIAGEPAAGDDSGDLDDRSFNESNSTSQKPEEATTTTVIVKDEQNDVEAVEEVGGEKKAQVKTESVGPGTGNEPDPVRTGKGPGSERVNGEERDNKKQTSDVQSSASLSKKKRRRFTSGDGSSSAEEREGDEVSPAMKRALAVKPESLVRLLGIIRSHRLGSAFGRCQRSQESERYKILVRQHMDLERIESRLDEGVYSDCSAKFFRDLLLLFNNIIIFHRKNSPEHIAAQELRALVLKEISDELRKQPPQPANLKPGLDQPPESLPKPNKSSTIVACNKRSSIKALTQNASRRGDKKERKVEEKPKATEKKVNTSYFSGIDDNGIRKKRSKERAVSGRRNSLRTSSKSGETKHEYGGNELSSHDALELKVDKKENMARKKESAASFLKRMKQNSPSEATDDEDGDDDSEGGSKDGKEEKGRGRKRDVKRVTRSSGGRGAREESGRVKRGVGRPPKRAAAAESTAKRGRDNAENEVGVGGGGRARKRSRR